LSPLCFVENQRSCFQCLRMAFYYLCHLRTKCWLSVFCLSWKLEVKTWSSQLFFFWWLKTVSLPSVSHQVRFCSFTKSVWPRPDLVQIDLFFR
jgi:hypothetical protein